LCYERSGLVLFGDSRVSEHREPFSGAFGRQSLGATADTGQLIRKPGVPSSAEGSGVTGTGLYRPQVNDVVRDLKPKRVAEKPYIGLKWEKDLARWFAAGDF